MDRDFQVMVCCVPSIRLILLISSHCGTNSHEVFKHLDVQTSINLSLVKIEAKTKSLRMLIE